MSAVLTNRDETGWPAHMGKKQKRFNGVAVNGVPGRFRNYVGSPAVTQTASDDAYSFNQKSTSRNASDYGGYLTFEVASLSKSQLVELRKRLSGELQQIRDLKDRIECRRISSSGNPRSSSKIKRSSVNRRPVAAAFDSAPNRAFNNGIGNSYLDTGNSEALMKDCKVSLGKLLRHKYAYIFKTPVDAVALRLHDYHNIVKRPMDLGTVRSKLNKNLYPSPVEFADDVKLTFNNAMLYNPMTDLVHSAAAQMLGRFEEIFRPLQQKIDSFTNQQSERGFQEFRVYDEVQLQGKEEVQGNLWNNNQNQSLVAPPRGKPVKPKAAIPDRAPHAQREMERIQMPMLAHSTASTPTHQLGHERVHSPVRGPPVFPVKDKNVGRGSMKQPKPNVKDENKREMTKEEKQKLGFELQNLPQERMPQFVRIINKNGLLAQDEDEIELDIDALDTETLWELNRFVQSLVVNNGTSGAGIAAPSTPIPEANMGAISDENVKNFKDDEDVDIDDMLATSFMPLEIEKDEGGERVSVSSSSSSESSSSNESDSGSSSG